MMILLVSMIQNTHPAEEGVASATRIIFIMEIAIDFMINDKILIYLSLENLEI